MRQKLSTESIPSRHMSTVLVASLAPIKPFKGLWLRYTRQKAEKLVQIKMSIF